MKTITFGDLAAGSWGAAWDAFTALGTADSTTTGTARIDGDDPVSEWELSGAGVSLTLSPVGEAATARGGLDGFDQLCRVRGRFELDGEHEVDCLGRRAVRSGVAFEEFESIRDVSAWFEGDAGLALTAMRPKRAKGHERDLITAAVFEEGRAIPVADPRLSTTYDFSGTPTRTTLELWFDEAEGEQYPRRAAGEATGIASAGTDVRAWLFRWHMRGLDGTGIYLLTEPR